MPVEKSHRGCESRPSNSASAMDEAAIQHRTQIVRGEYLDVPGLCLTRSQVQRLWGLDEAMCERVLVALMQAHFLRRTSEDRFVRDSSAVYGGGLHERTQQSVATQADVFG